MSASDEIFVIIESDGGDERIAAGAVSFLKRHLPRAHVEHIGSTSVPGCIGKGDVDVLVRVEPEEFGAAVEVLDGLLDRSTMNEPTGSYVEYDWHEAREPAAVHLVAVGGTYDDFHRFKALLLADADLLRRYNELKRRYDGHDMDEYREAKARFVEDALAAGGADQAPPEDEAAR